VEFVGCEVLGFLEFEFDLRGGEAKPAALPRRCPRLLSFAFCIPTPHSAPADSARGFETAAY